jgi:HSP20 family protein
VPTTRKSATPALSELLLLQREINDLVARMGGAATGSVPAGDWSPQADVFDRGDLLVIAIEVPGLAPDQVRVVSSSGHLIVSGERRQPRVGRATFHCLERPSGRFSRSVSFDGPVDLGRAEAVLARGVLTVTIPRLPERRGREVEIRVRRA